MKDDDTELKDAEEQSRVTPNGAVQHMSTPVLKLPDTSKPSQSQSHFRRYFDTVRRYLFSLFTDCRDTPGDTHSDRKVRVRMTYILRACSYIIENTKKISVRDNPWN